MKVLSLVSYNIFPAKMGGQKGIALFNEYFAAICPLLCVTVKSNDPQYAKGYTVVNKIANSKFRYINVYYFFLLKKIIRQHGITHLLVEHPYYGWLGVWLQYATGVKLIIHSHNIESVRWKGLGKWWWKLLYWYEGATHRKADFSFFIQEEDRQFAQQKYLLSASKCATISYGIPISSGTTTAEKISCKKWLQTTHHIAANETIVLFNGALNYTPNETALKNIVTNINPLLLSTNFKYKIIICGSGLSTTFNHLKDQSNNHIVYAGFVEDIAIYFKGADIFINPVTTGGGIKTKLIEALGYNLTVVTTQHGAIGVDTAVNNDKMVVVPNNHWQDFATAILKANINAETPDAFFKEFYWGNIVEKAKKAIS
jgi:polysaccharide biosynthesis protein PslH